MSDQPYLSAADLFAEAEELAQTERARQLAREARQLEIGAETVQEDSDD